LFSTGVKPPAGAAGVEDDADWDPNVNRPAGVAELLDVFSENVGLNVKRGADEAVALAIDGAESVVGLKPKSFDEEGVDFVPLVGALCAGAPNVKGAEGGGAVVCVAGFAG